MKVLWIVNKIMPYPAKKLGIKNNSFGGWLQSLLKEICNNKNMEKIGIVTIYNGKELKQFIDNNVIYYLVPCSNFFKYSKNLENYFRQIDDEFNPDIVHIQGTEFPYKLAYMNACPNNKYVTSIQGLVSEIYKCYYADIKKIDILKNITIRDILRNDNIFRQAKKFYKRGISEIEILKKTNYLIGRTFWDKKISYQYNNPSNYFVCNENLRKVFYNNCWDIQNIEKETIFVSQASYPIKGFHKLLEASCLLKNKYPNFKIYVAGEQITKIETIKDKLKLSGYGKYLRRLIKKYKLENNIVFTGMLTEKEMVKTMLKCNVFVQASAIENSSNSLGEAMLLGMPCVASDVGGTRDMLKNKEEGLLYSFSDSIELAQNISYIFDNDSKAIEFGKKAQIHAQKTHNRRKNAENILKIYNEILNRK